MKKAISASQDGISCIFPVFLKDSPKQLYAAPACRFSADQLRSQASVSWPVPKPLMLKDFKETWGKDIFLVKGVRRDSDLIASNFHSATRLTWEGLAAKSVVEIPVSEVELLHM